MMKRHITAVIVTAVLSSVFYTGCQEDNNGSTPVITMQNTKFDGALGDCTNGGVKLEVLVDGVVDETQTQYICNGVPGQDGQNGQTGSSTTLKTTKFDAAQGDCTNGGVKIEVLIDGVVDETQTQYICNGTLGQDGQNGQDGSNTAVKTTKFEDEQGGCVHGGVKIEVLIDGVVDNTQTQYICNGAYHLMYCNGIVVDTKIDSANCGACGNACEVNTECVNATCQPIADISTAAITCNTQTIIPASDIKNCGGCGIACENSELCKLGSCEAPSVGDTITFGRYEQDNDTTNGKEPIEWRVLDKNADGQLLVISEKVLEKKRYNETDRSITWEKSTIRSWLNGYDASYNSDGVNYTDDNFIDTAFTADEQAKIIDSNVPAHANPDDETSPGNATTDRIFLLSIVEANEYFADDASRQADATRYAVKQGVGVMGSESGNYSSNSSCSNVHCYAYWWLRSPGDTPDYAACVDYSGAVGTIGSIVYSDGRGVRPALWLNY